MHVISRYDPPPPRARHELAVPSSPTNTIWYRDITQLMMKKQDEGLEMLGQSAERLSQISMGIHEELGHQSK